MWLWLVMFLLGQWAAAGLFLVGARWVALLFVGSWLGILWVVKGRSRDLGLILLVGFSLGGLWQSTLPGGLGERVVLVPEGRIVVARREGLIVNTAEGRILLVVRQRAGLTAGERLQFQANCLPLRRHERFLTVVYRLRARCQVDGQLKHIPSQGLVVTIREAFDRQLRLFLADRQASLAAGFFLGGKTVTDKQLLAVLRQTGTIHLIAVSGYNFMVIAVVVEAVVGLLFSGAWLVLVTLLVLLGYAVLAGMTGSVWRAFLCVVFLQLARIVYRRPPALWMIGVVLALAQLIQPYILVSDLSFLLSLLAFFGISVVAPTLGRVFRRLFLPRWLARSAAETLAASAMITPVVALTFGPARWTSLPVNLVVLPLVPWAMMAILAAMTLSMLLPGSLWVATTVGAPLLRLILVVITLGG